MKRILVMAAGGSPATNFVRSLKQAPEKFYLVGVDCDKYYIHRAETDVKYLIPTKKDPKFVDVINKIIRDEKIDFVHEQNDSEMEFVSEHRDEIQAKMFLPAKETIRVCMDKFQSYQLWQKEGLPQPTTMMINGENDLQEALEKWGSKVWVREITGAGGKGSLIVESFKQGKAWIDFKDGWGKFTAAEYLSPDSITWQSIWKNGELVVAQGRKRLYWELAKISPSGITGATGAGVTVSDPVVDDIAQKAILAIDKKPQGIFSVDMTYDKNGVPNPTEINIGRFFTTHEFFTQAGLNMPYIFVKEAFGEAYDKPARKINPLPNDLLWIRGIDFLPKLTNLQELKDFETKRDEIIKEA